MKKILFLFLTMVIMNTAFAANDFALAIKTCESFEQEGTIPYNGHIFGILVTLEKGKKNECLYKERIFQGDSFQQLNCKFKNTDLSFISKSMQEYSVYFAKQIAKNPIMGVKMTNNSVVFQNYLVNPEYCQITHSKKSTMF